MSMNNRAVLPYGNDCIVDVYLTRYDETTADYITFDLTQCTDIEVYLTCSKHATHIPLNYDIDVVYNNIMHCPVDYRLLHPNTSYGIVVEGNDENENHWRFEMLPSEFFLVVSNSSGTRMPDTQDIAEVRTLPVFAKVGWGIPTVTINGQSLVGTGDMELIPKSDEIDYISELVADDSRIPTNKAMRTFGNQVIIALMSKYEKPANGIPEAHLEKTLQNKIDGAAQDSNMFTSFTNLCDAMQARGLIDTYSVTQAPSGAYEFTFR